MSIPEYDESADTFATEWTAALAHPRVRQLKRLSLPVWNATSTVVLAGTAELAGLESLDVSLVPDGGEWDNAAGERLLALALSPHLAGLTELTAWGGVRAEFAVVAPTWCRLRKLDLELTPVATAVLALEYCDDLTDLDDLRLSGLQFDADTIGILVRAPLLKRVRHLALQGWCEDRSLLKRLVGAVNADRIETFAFGPGQVYPPLGAWADGTAELRAAFGDRLRLL